MLIILSLIVLSGCDTFKSKGRIRVECGEQFPSNYEEENICRKKICEGMRLNPSSSGNWYDSIIYCEGDNGGIIEVKICNTDIPECQDMCDQRHNIQKCCIERGAGY